MKSATKILKKSYFRKTVIYFLTYCLVLNTSLPAVLAIDSGDVINSSGVISTVWGNQAIINTNNGAIIDWSNFNTSQNQSVMFNQYMNGGLSSASAVLNRITSGSIPTEFNGALNANGCVFIVNPAGVIFGAGATINVNQLVASSLGITNSNFLEGNYEFFAGEDSIGAVVNNGIITTAGGAALISEKVLNTGIITTGAGGFVVMAAGDRIVLGEPGSKIVVEMDSVTLPADAGTEGLGDVINESTGEITAPAGTIVLAAGDIFSTALELDSQVVKVESGTGKVEQNGAIHADGINGDGGSISLTAGDEVVLAPEALTTANGGLNGSGGNVILYSEGMTTFSEGALIEAQGGSESGDGGFIEISGENFIFAGDVDVSAQNGEGGTLLIDPVSVIVADGENVGALNTVYEEDIETFSQTGPDVFEIVADESIIVENILDNKITGGIGGITLRTTEAGSSISFDDKSDTITTTLGDIFIQAGGGGINIGNLATGTSDLKESPGEIWLFTDNGGNIQTGYLKALGGSDALVSVFSGGDLIITGTPNNGAVMAKTNNVPQADSASAEIYLQACGDIDITHQVEAEAHGKIETTVDVHICAVETVTVDTKSGQISSWAETSGKICNTETLSADAVVMIHAGSDATDAISITGNGTNDPVRAHAKVAGGGLADISSSGAEGRQEEEYCGAYTLIEIANILDSDCSGPDCPQPEPEPKPDPDPDPDPDPNPEPKSEPLYATAPIPEEELGYAGCPALMKWTADELGIDGRMMEIWTANALASSMEIQPCDTCGRLKGVATILQDAEGTYKAALGQVISEFASSIAPPSDEEMTLIANAISNNNGANNHYAAAGIYLDALTMYVGILINEMNLSTEDSVMFAANRYVIPLVDSESVGMAAFVAARLAAMGG